MPLLPLRPYSALQTILLSDLVGCDSPLQVVMDVGPLFKFEVRQMAITICSGLSRLTQFKFKEKCAKTANTITLSAEGCHTQLDRQHLEGR